MPIQLTIQNKCNIFAFNGQEIFDRQLVFLRTVLFMIVSQRKRCLTGTLAVAGLFLLISSANAQTGRKLPVFVSIPPQKYFVQQIGKELVDIEIMVPAGADVHTYEPKASQMVALSKTKIYFAVGIQPFESIWLKKITGSYPNLQVVHTDYGIQKIPIVTHHLHEAGAHEKSESGNGKDQLQRGGLDPHIWLSPPLVMIQARTILNAFQEIDPVHRAVYEKNCRHFVAELATLDAELKAIFAGRQGFQFMVFHPAWGYFARTYGLQQVPVEMEGKDPKPAQLKALIEHARQEHIKIIFVQPQFSSKSAKLVAKEIGGRVEVADPLASDWMENLREVAHKIKKALP
jgi:zinc transport system substrate-binding protein